MIVEASSTAEHMGWLWGGGHIPQSRSARNISWRKGVQTESRRADKRQRVWNNVLGRRNGMSRGPEVSDSMANSWN